MKREQIIETLKNPHWFFFGKLFESDFEQIADAILALPLDVPSDEEIMQKYPFFDEDIDLVSNLDNQEGAKWMKDEIIKRNK